MSLRNILLLAVLHVAVAGFSQPVNTSRITNAYYGIQEALANDNSEKAATEAGELARLVKSFPADQLKGAQLKVWNRNKEMILQSSVKICLANNLTDQRSSLNELSESLFALLKEFDQREGEIYYMYCPMKKAYWISDKNEIRNPYYGKKMLTCGSVKETLK